MSNYRKLAPYIIDQLFPYQDLNLLKDNIANVAEAFGVTTDYSENGVPSVTVDMGLGAFAFQSNSITVGYANGFVGFEADTAGGEDLTRFELADGYLLYGDRLMLQYYSELDDNEPYGTTQDESVDMGYIMTRAGSILSLNFSFQMSNIFGEHRLSADVEKNGVSIITGTQSVIVDGAIDENDPFGVTDKFTRGDESFSAGDRLEVHFRLDPITVSPTPTIEGKVSAFLEVIFD